MSTHFRRRIWSSVAGGKGGQKAPEGCRHPRTPRLITMFRAVRPISTDSHIAGDRLPYHEGVHRGWALRATWCVVVLRAAGRHTTLIMVTRESQDTCACICRCLGGPKTPRSHDSRDLRRRAPAKTLQNAPDPGRNHLVSPACGLHDEESGGSPSYGPDQGEVFSQPRWPAGA